MCDKLVEKGRDPSTVDELRNWAEVHAVVPQPSHASTYRERWGITTEHVALYSGSIAKKQGIEIIVDVARALRSRHDLTFVVCGNGPSRPELEAHAAGLTNILFQDLQPKEELGQLLTLATLHLLPQKRGAADLVLPSKLTNMLASGRPVIAGAAPDTGLAREVDGCGLAVAPDDAGAMAAAIEQLLFDPALYAAAAAAARQRAEQFWSRSSIIDRFESVLAETTAVRRST
jgi:colanic acid biosynthesis glycosyl transferase WcaI